MAKKMTREEFIKKFKVGDLITCHFWDTPEEIKYIGSDSFIIDTYKGVDFFDFKRDWIKPNKIEIEDLSNYKRFFLVKIDNDNIKRVLPYYATCKGDLAEQVFQGDEVLTEKEALKRGLKI